MPEVTDKPETTARRWGKRAGAAAFVFFLVKGLIWLGVFAAGAWYVYDK
jgi:hypothetical protein